MADQNYEHVTGPHDGELDRRFLKNPHAIREARALIVQMREILDCARCEWEDHNGRLSDKADTHWSNQARLSVTAATKWLRVNK